MSSNRSTLEQALYVREVIQQETSRTTAPMLAAFGKTLVVTLIVFLVVLFIGGYLRLYLDSQFEDQGLNTLTAVSTSLLMLALTYWTAKWAEGRFHGWARLRLGMALVSRVRALEVAIEGSRNGQQVTRADLEDAAASAWAAYTRLAEAVGIVPIEAAEDPLELVED